jgi:replicative DNA helicase
MEEIVEQSKNNANNIELQLAEKEKAITMLTEGHSSNNDAIGAISDRLQELMDEVERLKRQK